MKLLTALVAALLLAALGMASASPCAGLLEPTQAALDTYIETVAARGATATESTGALLDHDPSPEGLAKSEAAIGDGTVPLRAQQALDAARAAQKAGDEAGCLAGVAKARGLIGLK